MIVKFQANGVPAVPPAAATPNKVSTNPVVSDADPDLAGLLATLNALHKTAQAVIAKHKASMPPPAAPVAPAAAPATATVGAPPAAPVAPAPAKPNPFAKKPNPFAKKAKFSNNVDDLDPNDDPEDDGLDPNDDPENVDDDEGIDSDDDPRSYPSDDPEDDENDEDEDDEYSVLDPTKSAADVTDYGDEHGKNYPIGSKAQIKSAWTAVQKHAADHNAIDLVAIKGKIKAAAAKAEITLPD